VNMLKNYKQNSIRVDRASKMDASELQGKIIEGEFVDCDKTELIAGTAAMQQRIRGKE
jgi:hypothetical protein